MILPILQSVSLFAEAKLGGHFPHDINHVRGQIILCTYFGSLSANNMKIESKHPGSGTAIGLQTCEFGNFSIFYDIFDVIVSYDKNYVRSNASDMSKPHVLTTSGRIY